MIPPVWKPTLTALAVTCVLSFGAGWKLRDYQAQEDALGEARKTLASVQNALIERDALTVAEALKSRTLEETLAAMRKSAQEARVTVEKEYVEKPIYAQCVVPDGGVRAVNDRVAARHPARDPGKR